MAKGSGADERLLAEFAEAVERGRKASERGPRARAAWYDRARNLMMIELTSGYAFGFPPDRAQGLRGASGADLNAVELEGNGYGLHWEALDADLSVPGLLAGMVGSAAWMRELGRRGGAVKSPAKARAARANGRKGGRPRSGRRDPNEGAAGG